jgi:hypothetical protein
MIEAFVILAAAVVVGIVMLHRQLNAIHELVNSNLTKAQTDLALADARIRTLEDHISHEPRAGPSE